MSRGLQKEKVISSKSSVFYLEALGSLRVKDPCNATVTYFNATGIKLDIGNTVKMAARFRNIKSAFVKPIEVSKLKYKVIEGKINAVQFPEKYKGTVLEKWKDYWKQLLWDYREAFVNVGKEMYSKPIKATTYVTGLSLSYYCFKNNPDIVSYRDDLLNCSNQILLIGESSAKHEAVRHLKFIEQCYNQGLIRRLTIGIASFIWIDDYDEALAIYKATCPYLEPQYLTFKDRIVDIGFLKTWWILKDKMIDYDVNY